ncbi:MAG: TolC family protein [Dictyoglomus sp.]|nr:TolC family protein [Dictyoglomus sp.]MDW8188702.1 TolC family protein [Dictyoglomus sp.]
MRFNNTKLQVIQSVRNAYFSVLEARAQLKLFQKQVELAKEQLEAAKIKFQLGNTTSLDVQQAEINYLSTQNNLKSGMNSLNILWSQFCETLGIFPMENLKLQELPILTLNLKLDDLLAIANVEFYELQVKLYDNEYTPKFQLINVKNSLESAKIIFTQSLNNAKITISQRLDQLNLSLENLEIEKRNLELAKENYRIANIRFFIRIYNKA